MAAHALLTALVAFCASTASADVLLPRQGLANCPSRERTVGPFNNQFLSICPGTDYWSPNIQQINNIATVDACADQCAKYPGCAKASYNAGIKTCYLKGDPTSPTWFAAADLATIRVMKNLDKCPVNERDVGTFGNKLMTTCPGTDYYSPNINVFDNIATVDDCAARCGNTNGCSIASYNAGIKTCYLKGNPTNPIWFSKPDLATIRVAATSNCPRGTQRVTLTDGSTAVVCLKSDYYTPNVYAVGNVPNVGDCANRCGNTAGCLIASYNRVVKICYLKGNPANPNIIASDDLDGIQLAKQGTDRPGPPGPPMGPLPQYPGVGSNAGKWSAVFSLPVIPVAGYVVPEWPEANRIMVWSAWAKNKFSLWTPPNGYTQFAEYNYKTKATSARTISNTGHDMFCPGVSMLQDGKIVITGGSNAEVTSIYDPASNSFTRAADMKIPRGYQTSVTLSNGRIFTIGGAFSGPRGNKYGEVYNPSDNSWTPLPGAKSDPNILTSYDWEGDWRTDNHAWLFPWKDGSVFHAGPSMAMNWIGTQGSGSIQPAGVRDPESDAMCGIHVMFDATAGKIFSAGGSQSYTASQAFSRAHLITITTAFRNATVERLPDMLNRRGFGNIVVLPNGQLLITGGQRVSRVFQDDDSVFTAELFDPPSKTFRRLAAAKTPRNYHAISLLLADGTVFTGGGGMCGNLAPGQDDSGCNRAIDHQDGEIFSPPYLFNDDMTPATRPIIFSVDSAGSDQGRAVKAGATITVHMNYPTQHSLALVRMGSATHSVNSDQRRIPLKNIQRSSAAHTVTLPSDYGILLPGYYYLFAMNDRGVPSVARTIQIVL